MKKKEVLKVGLDELWSTNVFRISGFKKKISFLEEEHYFEDSFNNIESQFSVEDIQFLIDSLPYGYKIIFNLYAIEGYKHKEISSMLGINEGTSKSQLSHARKILKEQILTLKNYSNGTE